MNRSLEPASFPHPLTLGIALHDAAMLNVYRGEAKLALAKAHEASEICRKHGFVYYLSLADISRGFAFLSKNGEAWSASELHRIHGDLLLHGGDTSQSQNSYRRALELARQTGSRLFEQRATSRLNERFTLENNQQNFAER